jgi:hypothetical protein
MKTRLYQNDVKFRPSINEMINRITTQSSRWFLEWIIAHQWVLHVVCHNDARDWALTELPHW